jgi:hypothetical protein
MAFSLRQDAGDRWTAKFPTAESTDALLTYLSRREFSTMKYRGVRFNTPTYAGCIWPVSMP